MPAKATFYTFAQLEQLWINAGGSKALAPTMAAIALAESSGNPAATNPRDNNGRQTSWGLWQISDGTHNMPRPNILDPATNAKAAVAKYKSQGLTAWGTYTSGKFRDFLKNAAPDPNLPGGSTSTAEQAGAFGDIGGAIGEGLGNAFKAVLQPVLATMIWSSEILLGIGLMVGGVIVFILNTEAGKRTTATVANTALNTATAAGSVAAPEAAPELAAIKVSRGAVTAPVGAAKSAQGIRVANSRAEFMAIRRSGYKGKIRHDYD